MSEPGNPWKMLAIALVAAMALGGTCTCGGLGWLVYIGDEADEADEGGRHQGERDGDSFSSEQCILEGHRRISPCGILDVSCNEAAEGYIQGCLTAVVDPDPALCNGVPAPSLLGDFAFAGEFCRARGLPTSETDGGCDSLVQAVALHCQVVRNRGSLNAP